MRELQRRVHQWATDTFGLPTLKRGVERVQEELTELGALATQDNPPIAEVAEEMADVVICLMHTAATFGIDLQAAVELKFGINLRRKWKKSDDGTGYHVK